MYHTILICKTYCFHMTFILVQDFHELTPYCFFFFHVDLKHMKNINSNFCCGLQIKKSHSNVHHSFNPGPSLLMPTILTDVSLQFVNVIRFGPNLVQILFNRIQFTNNVIYRFSRSHQLGLYFVQVTLQLVIIIFLKISFIIFTVHSTTRGSQEPESLTWWNFAFQGQ